MSRKPTDSQITAIQLSQVVGLLVADDNNHVTIEARVIKRNKPRLQVDTVAKTSFETQWPGLLRALEHFSNLDYLRVGAATKKSIGWWLAQQASTSKTPITKRRLPSPGAAYALPYFSSTVRHYDLRHISRLWDPETKDDARYVEVLFRPPAAPGCSPASARAIRHDGFYVKATTFDQMYPGLTTAWRHFKHNLDTGESSAQQAVDWWIRNATDIATCKLVAEGLGMSNKELQLFVWQSISDHKKVQIPVTLPDDLNLTNAV